MAQAPQKDETSAPAPQSNKGLIIIVALLVFMLIAGGGGVAFYMLKQKPSGTHSEAQQNAVAAEVMAPPVFVPFETFTVNLLPDPDERFLQLDLTMQVKNAEVAEKLKAQMPTLRNRVLMLLTSKKSSDISTPDGKALLSQDLLAELKQPLVEKGKPLELSQVLFTSFVIQ